MTQAFKRKPPRWRTVLAAAGGLSLAVSTAGALDFSKFVLGDQNYLSKEAETHWAFQPVTQPSIPAGEGGAWAKTPVDSFVLAKMAEAGLTPSPEAAPAVLVRRLFFDLIGLPPTAEEIATWTRGWSDARYAELVDHLLASPHYGERWGRYWLDIARYADTKGYMAGGVVEKRYPFAYTYRDWVVQALNEDVPYDEFLTRQIAADFLLERGEAEKKDLAALGFLTVGSRFNGKQDLVIDDRIDVVTRGMMGLTVSCARCHDHMFDPVPTADYYSLYGVFSSSTEPEELPQLLDEAELSEAHRAFEKKRAEVQAEADDFVKGLHRELRTAETVAAYLRFVVESRGLSRPKTLVEAGKRNLFVPVATRWTAGLAAAKKMELGAFMPWHAAVDLFAQEKGAEAEAALRELVSGEHSGQVNAVVAKAMRDDLPESLGEFCDLYGKLLAENDGDEPHADEAREELRQVLRHPAGPTGFPWKEMPRHWDRAARDKYGKLVGKVEKLIVDSPDAPPRAMVVADAENPADAAVFVRGNPRQRGEVVPRQFLAVLEGEDRVPFAAGSGRLELAEKIAVPSNPLTARVMVNRIWRQHFGKGLVETPSDFGLQTDEPLQRNLLDWLSARFVKDGWSMKALHRLLVTSATYRQASAGAGVRASLERDPENRYWVRMERRRLDYEATRDALLAVSGELNREIGGRPELLEGKAPTVRRAIYGFIDRYAVPPMMRTFDFADPNLHAPKRSETTVPQQALFFMNSPFVEARGRAVLEGIGEMNAEERVRALYRRVLLREPNAGEVAAAMEFVGGQANNAERWLDLAQALLASNEFAFVD